MGQVFKALRDFKSREFKETQYVKGMTYTIRKGNSKLEKMTSRWLKAKLFSPTEDLELFGAEFKAGVVSYCIDDSFADIVKDWVETGKAEYVEGSLITFNNVETKNTMSGSE